MSLGEPNRDGSPVMIRYLSRGTGEAKLRRAGTSLALLVSVAGTVLSGGCNVGPKYQRASVDTPPAYKEIDGWKAAQPQDDTLRGKWWKCSTIRS